MEEEKVKSPAELRKELRAGSGKLSSTSGLCPGFQQANLGFVPSSEFENFSKFCEANPGRKEKIYIELINVFKDHARFFIKVWNPAISTQAI